VRNEACGPSPAGHTALGSPSSCCCCSSFVRACAAVPHPGRASCLKDMPAACAPPHNTQPTNQPMSHQRTVSPGFTATLPNQCTEGKACAALQPNNLKPHQAGELFQTTSQHTASPKHTIKHNPAGWRVPTRTYSTRHLGQAWLTHHVSHYVRLNSCCRPACRGWSGNPGSYCCTAVQACTAV
jgi:hypothetical protein